MRPYQWMYPFALIFAVLGGYGLSISILGGSFLIATGCLFLAFKWKLQSDVPEAKDEVKG